MIIINYSPLVFSKTKQFIENYGAGIAKAIAGTGLFFPAMVAQSALESGYGEHIPKNSNNFGGIKYAPNLEGVIGYVIADSVEIIGNKATPVKFSRFVDVEAGFKAHIRVLLNERYKKARLDATTPEEQILMIAKAGYTLTPAKEYLRRMQSIINAARDYSELGRIS